MINKSINLKDMKRINKAIILNNIWKCEQLSRTELSEKIGLSPATITALVEELLSEKMIEELGVKESTGGRKPVMLKINSNGGYICAINVMKYCITYTIINMDLENIYELSVRNYEEIIIQDLFESLVTNIDAVLSVKGIAKEKLIGIGINFCKEYEEIDKKVMLYTGLSADRMNLDQALSFYYKKPAFIETEINIKAIAEYHFGNAKYYDGFIYIDVSDHVNASIVYEGAIVKSPLLQNNDRLHMIIDRNGAKCSCGRRGCIDVIASLTAVLKKTAIGLNEGKDMPLFIAVNKDTKKIDINLVIKYANEGNGFIRTIINEVSEALCICILNFSSILNIHNFVIGGNARKIEYFPESLLNAAKKFNLTQDNKIIITMAALSEDCINMGNGAIVLNNYFKNI